MNFVALKLKALTGFNIDTSTWGVIKSLLYVIGTWIATNLAMIGIDHKLLTAVGILMILDFFSGIWKVRRLGEKPTSSKASDGALKKMVLLLIPIIPAFFLWRFGIKTEMIFRGFFFIVGLAEVYSIWQNCYSAAKREKIDEYDSFTAIMKWLGNLIFKMLKKKLDDEDPKV